MTQQDVMMDRQVSAQAYLHTPGAGVVVPLFQAVVSGFLVALVVLVGLAIARVEAPWQWAGLAWMLVMAVMWFSRLRHWWRLTDLEQMTGIDINQDGVIGEPAREVEDTVILNMRSVTSDGRDETTRVRTGLTRQQLQTIAMRVLHEGKSWAEDDWLKNKGKGGPYGDTEWSNIRGQLLQAGIIEPKDVKHLNLGYRTTRPGLAALAYYAPIPYWEQESE